MSADRFELLGMPRAELEALFAQLGSKPFHARQMMRWMYKSGLDDVAAMTDLPAKLRDELVGRAEIRAPEVLREQHSSDGTRKWLLAAGAGQAIEMVFIPEPDRGTLCISSQVGCALDCTFCSTGAQGFNRNLSAAEIVGQVWLACRELGPHPDRDRHVTNVVLMGMGEPLANYRNVLPALRVLLDPLAFDYSRRRVTLSTSGLVPQIRRLGEDCNVALAVSLHAPNDALRDELVPINRRHPLEELLDACWHYAGEQTGRHITFEYVMLAGVNDRPEHAHELLRRLRRRPAKVNLIPFNPFPGTRYERSSDADILGFRNTLVNGGLNATIRRTRGDDIDAACGQLAGRVRDRTLVRLGTKLVSMAVQA
jgi:23S rRNA (adenine2503-C2)-methyltransferase